MKTITDTRKVKSGAIVALLLAAPLLAACGGSDSGKAAGSDTIKVFNYGPYDGKGFSIPGIKTGAVAGVEKINAEGGINGHKIELITCNDGNDPNTAAGCARKAVEEKVVAVIGGFSAFEPQILPVLEKAGIPVVGGTPIANFTSPVLYPFTGGAAASFFGLGKWMTENPTCKGTVGAVIEDFAATQGAVGLFQLGVLASGGTFTGISKAPQGARDFAPAVSAASEKAGCIGFVSGPQTGGTIITAAKKTPAIKVLGASESVFSVKALGSAADGVVILSNYVPLNTNSDNAKVKDFLARANKIDPKYEVDQGSTSAFLASGLLREALKGAGEITPQTVIAGLNKVSHYDTGFGPVVDYTTPNPSKAFSRLPLSSPMYEWVAKDGGFVLGSDKTLDISDIYEAAAKAGK